MDSTKLTAHRAGAMYFLFMILCIFGEFLFPRFLVSGNAAATAHNITAALPAFRLGILLGLVTHLLFILLVATLYKLFEHVDRWLSVLMVLLVSIGIAVAIANLSNKYAPLVLLSGDSYLSVLAKPELEALSLAFLKLHSAGVAVTTVFWGLWLFPFGLLVIKSGYFPKILGVLLMVAGIAYVASSVTAIVMPEHRLAVARAMTPLYFGEVPIIFWLLIGGARVRQPQTTQVRADGPSPRQP